MCVIAYSTVDRESFLAVENWRKKVYSLVYAISDVFKINFKVHL